MGREREMTAGFKHGCAYCGERRCYITDIKKDGRLWEAKIFCPDCGKEDWPAIRNDNPVLLSAFITP